MKLKFAAVLLAGVAAAGSTYAFVGGNSPAKAQTAASEPETQGAVAQVPFYRDREAFFGDLHLHTTNSFDAYVLMGTRITPDEAYRFASGETIDYLGRPIRREVPLDFLAVTDHSENIGVFNQLDDPNSDFSKSEVGQIARKGGVEAFMKLLPSFLAGKPLPGDTATVSASAWAREIAAANANYRPGKFTSFIAYEWTAMPDGQNLHRNVIFAGNNAPAPFTSIDSNKPEDLWAYLSRIRAAGHDAIAIPHNANASNGLMYDWNTSKGRPIDEAYAQLRATNEFLSEISQNKGTSETHPALSSNDEFARFEIFDTLLIGNKPSKPSGSYWRDSLGRGLVIGSRIGLNPYKDGAVGASDLHSGLSVQSEQEYGGIAAANLGGGKLTREQVLQALGYQKPTGFSIKSEILSPGSLTGVWAESNTREAIFAAFRRKETFATSGTRIKLRFFGGWGFNSGFTDEPNWVHRAYTAGVPMGSDLQGSANGQAPSFAIQAVKDPNSGNLDRVQVVKLWLENGGYQERVFDVAWSGQRKADPRTGKLERVGNTVDLKTGKYTNSIGTAQLRTVWRDPTFRADQPAVYYVRVLEIPTPRWSTLRAIEYHLPLPKDVPATIQERAWSSPIWYSPAKQVAARISQAGNRHARLL